MRFLLLGMVAGTMIIAISTIGWKAEAAMMPSIGTLPVQTKSYTPVEKVAYWRRAYRRGYYGYGYPDYGYALLTLIMAMAITALLRLWLQAIRLLWLWAWLGLLGFGNPRSSCRCSPDLAEKRPGQRLRGPGFCMFASWNHS